MADITERLREHAAIHEAQVPFDNEQREWADDLRFAAAEIARLRARVAELEAERADDDALRERMSDIMKRTAIALRGPEPPLTAWSWHDLPERAAAAITSIDVFQRVAHKLADPRGLVPMLVDRFLAWKLPGDFAPDGGISFTLISQDHPELWPTGTCLLNAPQATAMFEHLLGIDPPAPTVDVDAISDDEIFRGVEALVARNITADLVDTDDMRAALRAIFNKGE